MSDKDNKYTIGNINFGSTGIGDEKMLEAERLKYVVTASGPSTVTLSYNLEAENKQLQAEIQRLRTVLEDIANNPPGSSWRLIKIAKEALTDCKKD